MVQAVSGDDRRGLPDAVGRRGFSHGALVMVSIDVGIKRGGCRRGLLPPGCELQEQKHKQPAEERSVPHPGVQGRLVRKWEWMINHSTLAQVKAGQYPPSGRRSLRKYRCWRRGSPALPPRSRAPAPARNADTGPDVRPNQASFVTLRIQAGRSAPPVEVGKITS